MHDLELFMSNDVMEAMQNLHNVFKPASAALTAKPEMVFESGRVKIKAPIAAKAHLGAYTIEVQAVHLCRCRAPKSRLRSTVIWKWAGAGKDTALISSSRLMCFGIKGPGVGLSRLRRRLRIRRRLLYPIQVSVEEQLPKKQNGIKWLPKKAL